MIRLLPFAYWETEVWRNTTAGKMEQREEFQELTLPLISCSRERTGRKMKKSSCAPLFHMQCELKISVLHHLGWNYVKDIFFSRRVHPTCHWGIDISVAELRAWQIFFIQLCFYNWKMKNSQDSLALAVHLSWVLVALMSASVFWGLPVEAGSPRATHPSWLRY